MRQAQRLAMRAINERGVALYNSGDVAGCARVYAEVISEILGIADGVPTAARAGLGRALEEASRSSEDVDAQAWALRGALDRFVSFQAGDNMKVAKNRESTGPLLSFCHGIPATTTFRSLDDRVMGGKSKSELTFDSDLAAAVFKGTLVLEGGGFASVRANVRWSLKSAHALVMTASSRSGGVFKLRLQDTSRIDSVYHQAEFVCPGDGIFRKYEMPLESFTATWRGMPQGVHLDRGRIQSVGFMVSKFSAGSGKEVVGAGMSSGSFDLAIRELKDV